MTARIPTRSLHQAMDWSLVLMSQGIEAIIEAGPETGWGLVVSAAEHDRALAVLEQYRKENLRQPWRRSIPGQGLLFDWGSLAWALLLGCFFWLQTRFPIVHDRGLMDAAAVSRGEWWRLFTAVFLHADIGHLATNATIGFVLLGLTMGRFGTGLGLLSAYLAGAAGNAAPWLIFPGHLSLGASGMVMGCVGLLAAQSFSISRGNPGAMKYAVTGLIGGGLLFVLMGLGAAPRTDFLAHFGGFAGGLLLGTILIAAPELARSRAAQTAAGALFTGLVLLAWGLALR